MAKSAVEFREATQADLNDLIELVLTDEPPARDAALRAANLQCDRLERQQRDEIVWIVGEQKGDLVAQAVFRWPHQPDRSGRPRPFVGAEIEDLRVHPAHRGRSLGRELLENLEWRCLREDVEALAVTLDPDREQPGKLWLERRGYAQSGEPYTAGGAARPADQRAVDGRPEPSAGPRRIDMVKDLLAG